MKQVVCFKLLKNTSFELDKVIGHHNGEEGFAVGVDGHVECDSLHQHDYGVDEHVQQSTDVVKNSFKVFRLLSPSLRGQPVECVQCVLPNGRQEAVKYLVEGWDTRGL